MKRKLPDALVHLAALPALLRDLAGRIDRIIETTQLAGRTDLLPVDEAELGGQGYQVAMALELADLTGIEFYAERVEVLGGGPDDDALDDLVRSETGNDLPDTSDEALRDLLRGSGSGMQALLADWTEAEQHMSEHELPAGTIHRALQACRTLH